MITAIAEKEKMDNPNDSVEEHIGSIDETSGNAEDQAGADSHSSSTSTSADIENKEDEVAALRRMNLAQSEQIERLKHELNQAQVKHGEEMYWVRLELDSSRLEKEAVEDRWTELYRDVQEMVTEKNSPVKIKEDAQTQVCTEEDYVSGMESRIEALERTIELMNHQMMMLKDSSGALVSSLRQELTDLMEEKSRMEIDLLNQISILDVEKQRLETRLFECARRVGPGIETKESEDSSLISKQFSQQGPPFASSLSPILYKSASENDPNHTPVKQKDVPKTDESATKETSFRSTDITQALTQGEPSAQLTSLSTSVVGPISQADIERDFLGQEQEEAILSLRQEANTLKNENETLQKKLKEVTKELMYTQTSANTVLAMSTLRLDREETLAHLDRISVLWERADQSVQALESLLSDFQLKPSNQKLEHDGTKEDKEFMLSTLETTALVYGQVKMSLMHIELSFRNHLTSIQNDASYLQRQQLEQYDVLLEKLQQVRSETFDAISSVENKWSEQVAHLEGKFRTDTATLQQTVNLRLEDLNKTQERHKALTVEFKNLKQQLEEQQPKALQPYEAPRTEDTETTIPKGGPQTPPKGLVVSHSVMMRLQKEVLSVVEQVQEKNNTIGQLSESVAKHKKREEVLKKELKRARQIAATATSSSSADAKHPSPVSSATRSQPKQDKVCEKGSKNLPNAAGSNRKSKKSKTKVSNVSDLFPEDTWTAFP